MRILFMGTPDFAAVSLRRLVEDGHEVCGVFTQPDKPRNRNKVTFSPVKEYALSQGIPVYQPLKLRDGTALSDVRALAPELIVVVAYGRILPDDILAVPPLGAINVHASLLPKYRGAAPINWAILNGETETGVSIMYLARELDAGDVICTASTPIGPEEDAPSLWARLAELGAQTLARTLPALAAGTAPRTPQDSSASTYAPMLSRELSAIDWSRDAAAITNQVRGLIPWPCASAVLDGRTLKIFRTRVGRSTHASPGTVLSAGRRGIEVACGDAQSLFLTELQAEGGRRMAASDYLLGHPMNCENT
jgi:methionyl-tRNA formyltransferase